LIYWYPFENHKINKVWEVEGLKGLVLLFRFNVTLPHLIPLNKYYFGKVYGDYH
jgi:hypothetical protein